MAKCKALCPTPHSPRHDIPELGTTWLILRRSTNRLHQEHSSPVPVAGTHEPKLRLAFCPLRMLAMMGKGIPGKAPHCAPLPLRVRSRILACSAAVSLRLAPLSDLLTSLPGAPG